VSISTLLTTTSASPQTWAVPNNVPVGTLLNVESWGAGSGGSGSSTSFRAGGAGGAYATAASDYFVTPDNAANGIPFTLNTGSAGTAAANSTAGTDTSFGSNVNLLTNSRQKGAVAGTPGTLPTRWSVTTNSSAGNGLSLATCGLAQTVVGFGLVPSGTGAGIPYIDINISGTTNTNTAIGVIFQVESQTATALPNVAYTTSGYASLSSTTNIGTTTLFFDSTASGSFLAFHASGNLAFTTSLVRYSFAFTPTEATMNTALVGIQVNLSSSTAYNFTIRIAGMQFEQAGAATAWKATPGGYVLAKGGGATSGTTGGVGGLASACLPTAGAFNGGSGATRIQGGGGGGAAGKNGAGGSSTTGTGATGDNALGGAAGVSNVEGGGGATASAAPTTAGAPGGGGGANTSTGSGSSGGRGQIRLTIPDLPFWQQAQMLPIMAQ